MNKVWLITGAGRGFGRAFAEEAVSRGDFVIAGIRRPIDDEFSAVRTSIQLKWMSRTKRKWKQP